MPSTLILCLSLVTILAFARFIFVLLFPKNHLDDKGPAVIVLGSGGHTAEMLAWMKQQNEHNKNKISLVRRKFIFIVSATDNHSAQAAKKFSVEAKLVRDEDDVIIKVIPRAREVGQSYFTSIFTTLKAIGASLKLLLDLSPTVIISNGPGVAVPVVVADFLVCAFFPIIKKKFRRASLLYIESFACVDHISLSGQIFISTFLASKFLVQWPKLAKSLQRVYGTGRVAYTGPFDDEDKNINKRNTSNSNNNEVDFASLDTSSLYSTNSLVGSAPFRPLNIPAQEKQNSSNVCVVTVGSTKFDDLIKIVNTLEFEKALLRLGIDELLVQQGACNIMQNGESNNNKSYDPATRLCLRKKTVVNYKHGLQSDIQNAALVISHAGAGTILEAMSASVPTVVVPNNKLMANHQLELALALAFRGYLLCANPELLLQLLTSLEVDWRQFKKMPDANVADFCKVAEGFFSF